MDGKYLMCFGRSRFKPRFSNSCRVMCLGPIQATRETNTSYALQHVITKVRQFNVQSQLYNKLLKETYVKAAVFLDSSV